MGWVAARRWTGIGEGGQRQIPWYDWLASLSLVVSVAADNARSIGITDWHCCLHCPRGYEGWRGWGTGVRSGVLVSSRIEPPLIDQ
jgi:hypothetical protein